MGNRKGVELNVAQKLAAKRNGTKFRICGVRSNIAVLAGGCSGVQLTDSERMQLYKALPIIDEILSNWNINNVVLGLNNPDDKVKK